MTSRSEDNLDLPTFWRVWVALCVLEYWFTPKEPFAHWYKGLLALIFAALILSRAWSYLRRRTRHVPDVESDGTEGMVE